MGSDAGKRRFKKQILEALIKHGVEPIDTNWSMMQIALHLEKLAGKKTPGIPLHRALEALAIIVERAGTAIRQYHKDNLSKETH